MNTRAEPRQLHAFRNRVEEAAAPRRIVTVAVVYHRKGRKYKTTETLTASAGRWLPHGCAAARPHALGRQISALDGDEAFSVWSTIALTSVIQILLKGEKNSWRRIGFYLRYDYVFEETNRAEVHNAPHGAVIHLIAAHRTLSSTIIAIGPSK
ncbi:unnamed protein product [Haemonchus placei]|uniref:Uncharacterized protein n=1 Tax=Haemonchus placei TaxID=6290 RepID=A0A0N4WDK2_HAEPC|nr:unnamed protein product [Haemonchus placei]